MSRPDHLIIGSGALARFASFKAAQKGYSSLRIGSGQTFDRFLILHENTQRNFERNFGQTFGHPLNGLKIVDKNLRLYRTMDFRRYRTRIHSARYSRLLDFLDFQDRGPHMEAMVSNIDRNGRVTCDNGETFEAGRSVINTAKGFQKPLFTIPHKKSYQMAFAKLDFDREWVWQINDKGIYAAVVPFEEEFALVYSGNPEAMHRLLKDQVREIPFRELHFQSYFSPAYHRGKIYSVGEAVRRMHPHTGQGLNRGLDTIDAIFEGKRLTREMIYDFILLLGGVFLEKSWGSRPALSRFSYRMLDNRFGMRLLSATL